jgi:hypothetical protein
MSIMMLSSTLARHIRTSCMPGKAKDVPSLSVAAITGKSVSGSRLPDEETGAFCPWQWSSAQPVLYVPAIMGYNEVKTPIVPVAKGGPRGSGSRRWARRCSGERQVPQDTGDRR